MSSTVENVDPIVSQDNGTTTEEPTTYHHGGLQPHWLVIVIPLVIIIAIVLIGVGIHLWLKQRRKGRRSSNHTYPGAHERGQGRTGSTIDLPTSAAPMGEGLNELGEAPPPYPPPEDEGPKDNITTAATEMRGAAGESSASSSSPIPSSSLPNRSGAPTTPTTPEMRQSTSSQPPAYDAVMNRRVVSLTVPPTAVAGVTVAPGHA